MEGPITCVKGFIRSGGNTWSALEKTKTTAVAAGATLALALALALVLVLVLALTLAPTLGLTLLLRRTTGLGHVILRPKKIIFWTGPK